MTTDADAVEGYTLCLLSKLFMFMTCRNTYGRENICLLLHRLQTMYNQYNRRTILLCLNLLSRKIEVCNDFYNKCTIVKSSYYCKVDIIYRH